MYVFFFFKQNTAYEMRISDWSSDVCSSDLSDRLSKDGFDHLDRHRVAELAQRLVPRAGLDEIVRETLETEAFADAHPAHAAFVQHEIAPGGLSGGQGRMGAVAPVDSVLLLVGS